MYDDDDQGRRGPHEHEQPAIQRLHIELAAARRGVGHVPSMTAEYAGRVLAAIRADLPDAASRAAHEVGGALTLAELARFELLGDDQPDDPRPDLLWRAIHRDAVDAVRSSTAHLV